MGYSLFNNKNPYNANNICYVIYVALDDTPDFVINQMLEEY
jgi:hypothetical protein